MAQRLRAAFMEPELFSNSHQQQVENGISRRFIPSMGNPTEAFLMARCSPLLRVNSMEPLTTEVQTVLVRFTSWFPGRLGNGVKE